MAATGVVVLLTCHVVDIDLFLQHFRHHPDGLAFTRKQPGYISLEDIEDGSKEMQVWEKWTDQAAYESYLNTPERQPTSAFSQLVAPALGERRLSHVFLTPLDT